MKRPIALLLALLPMLYAANAQEYLEVPSPKPGATLYRTTYMEQDGKSVRSFTYRYDPSGRIALWVAYPLNASLIGSGSRGEGWTPDPGLHESLQAILYKGFPRDSGYDRGHQIPSADRLDPKANAQTFRFTNATPQLHTFNGGIWVELEKRVRTWAKRSDTLYVVTGCIPGKGSINDNAGHPVNIPSAYYKAVLRRNKTRSGATEWTACAVLLEHRDYPVGTWQQNAALFKENSITIRQLEKLTGETFFPLLGKLIPQQQINEIKNETSSDWWWR